MIEMVQFEYPSSILRYKDEIPNFLEDNNITATGNRSLISKKALEGFDRLGVITVLIREDSFTNRDHSAVGETGQSFDTLDMLKSSDKERGTYDDDVASLGLLEDVNRSHETTLTKDINKSESLDSPCKSQDLMCEKESGHITSTTKVKTDGRVEKYIEEFENGHSLKPEKMVEIQSSSPKERDSDIKKQTFDTRENIRLSIGGKISKRISNKPGKLIGSIFSIPIPVGDKLYGCTTFLCLSREHRGMGFTPTLIKNLSHTALTRKIPIEHGYHTTSRRLSENAIQLQGWYRPINVKKAKIAGFHCLDVGYSRSLPGYIKLFKVSDKIPADKKRSHANKCSTKNGTQAHTMSTDKIPSQHISSVDAQRICLTMNGGNFSYNPSVGQLKIWSKYYPTYVAYDKDIPVSIFSLNRFRAKIESSGEYVTVDQICLTLGRADVSLSGAINMSTGDVLIGYLIGGINEHMIRKELCTPSTDRPWLSLYNYMGRIKPDDVHVPLI